MLLQTVVAVVEQDPRRVRRLVGDPLRVRPRDQAVVAAGDDQARLVDALGHAVQAERRRALARLLGRRRARVVLDRLARERRQPVPVGGEVVRPAHAGDRTQRFSNAAARGA
jgi:hypothetical protein